MKKDHNLENISKWYDHIHNLMPGPYNDLSGGHIIVSI